MTDIITRNPIKMEQKNDKCIYTVITGNYNTLKDPKCELQGWDMICFTDDTGLTSSTWQIEVIPKAMLGGFGIKKTSRLFKILSCPFLGTYKTTVYIDGNVTILNDPTPLIDEAFPIQVMQHPSRHCIYEEGLAVQKFKLEDNELIIQQMNAYIADKFPEKLGLGQNCIIIRNTCNELMKLEDTWWKEVKKWSYRDQLSLMYSLWKTETHYKLIPEATVNKYFHKSFGRDNK